MSCTSIHLAAGPRELPPTSDGWRRVEASGVVVFACSCGVAAAGPQAGLTELAGPHLLRVGGGGRA